MNLREWSELHGLHYRTALRWHHDGLMPVETWRVGRLIMVGPKLPDLSGGATAVYARVDSPDQKQDLDRQVSRLCAWATEQGHEVNTVVAETGSGLNGKRRKLSRLLSDPEVGTIIVERRDRLARFGFELAEAAMVASGRKILVIDDTEADAEDDLIRDATEVLTSLFTRLYGRHSAKNRAERALAAAAGPRG